MTYNIWDILPVALFLSIILFLIGRSFFKTSDIDAFSPEKIKVGWFVIGMSLIATDVSLAFIIGSAGLGYQKGLATGSYGWTASLVMIVVALYVLPRLMRVGIKTLPEYLELHFSAPIRLVVSLLFLFFIVGVVLSSVFYSFAFLVVQVLGLDIQWLIPIVWTVGMISGAVLFTVGIERAMKLDVFIGLTMLAAGVFVAAVCIVKVGGFNALAVKVPQTHLSSTLPSDDELLPWTQVFLGGLWLLHFNYWAFNPPIIQKALVASTLSDAQKGYLLAASIKIVVPFLFVLPGVAGLVLYGNQIINQDVIFPMVLKELIPTGFKGFVLVAFGATIISSTNAMLNSAASIFTLDVFQRFIRPQLSDEVKKTVYRYSIVFFVLVAIAVAPYVRNYKHIFDLSQQIRSIITPGLLITFFLAVFITRSPASSAWIALMGTYPVYFVMSRLFPQLPAVDLFGVNVLTLLIPTVLWTLFKPLKKPIDLKGKREIRFERNLLVVTWSIFIVTVVLSVYLIFS
jgi:SSS family solute:Na+ symporter